MNYNNNFLDQNDEIYEDSVDEVIEEIVEYEEEEAQEAEQQAVVINQALSRIQQANLYNALLNHQLFSPGSASPEIIKAVSKEFKDFILSRLEILLGIKHEKPVVAAAIQQVFTDQEVVVLKSISKRLLEKENQMPQTPQPQTTPTPTINAVTPQQQRIQPVQPVAPKIQPVQAQSTYQEPHHQQQEPRRIIKKVVKKVVRQSPQQEHQPQRPQKRSVKAKTNNTSAITGEDLGQAISTDRPPMKMPTQAEMDMQNARLADMNSKGNNTISGGVNVSNIISKIK